MTAASRGRGVRLVVTLELACLCLLSYLLTLLGVSERTPMVLCTIWLAVITSLVWQEAAAFSGSKHEFVIMMASYALRVAYAVYRVVVNGSNSELRLGQDAVSFWRIATEYYHDIWTSWGSRGNYPFVLAFEFRVFGTNYFCAMLFNVLLVSLMVMTVARIMRKLEFDERQRLVGLSIAALAPYPIINSTDILREPIYLFLIAASFEVYVDYIRQGRYQLLVGSILLLMPVMLLHGGYFPILFVYLVVGTLGGGGKHNVFIWLLGLFIGVAVVVGITAVDPKGIMESLSNPEKLIEQISGDPTSAGSTYVGGWLRVTSWPSAIALTPIRTLLYLLSPLPMNWRGVADVVAFLLDSTIHLAFVVCAVRYLRHERENDARASNDEASSRLLVLRAATGCVVASAVVFGWGTSNAGTAIRHRDALISMEAACIALCVTSDSKRGRSGLLV